MALSPPQNATQGQPYWLSLQFYDETAGVLTDPSSVRADITYGGEAYLSPDVAGPFTWDGVTTSPTPGAVWRTGTGSFTLWWDVPASIAGGVYTVTWTAGYGGDSYLVAENFPMTAPTVSPVTSGDTGFWGGSLTYQPTWSQTQLAIQFGQVDSNGVAWILQGVKGWDSPPAAVGQTIQRSADHGGYSTAQFYGPRIITLSVWASAPTQALRDQARALLQQAVPISDLGVFQYDEPVPKQAYVRRNAQATVTETLPTLCDAVFSIPLVAPDPRKYSVITQTQSSVTPAAPPVPLSLPFTSGFPVTFPASVPPGTLGILAVNSGTFETRPIIVVTGPVTAPSVINGSTGQAITFSSLTLPANAQLTLDLDARQAYTGGVFTPADVSSSWWVLEPGTTLIYMQGTSAAGSTIQASWSSAWI